MQRGRTSKKSRLDFITSVKDSIEDCTERNASIFEIRTMRLLMESVTQLELELKKINRNDKPRDYGNLKIDSKADYSVFIG